LVIAHDLVPNANLTPSRHSLSTANKANLDVLSDAVISFAIDGHKFKADVSVLKKVDEFLLGVIGSKNKGLNGTLPAEP